MNQVLMAAVHWGSAGTRERPAVELHRTLGRHLEGCSGMVVLALSWEASAMVACFRGWCCGYAAPVAVQMAALTPVQVLGQVLLIPDQHQETCYGSEEVRRVGSQVRLARLALPVPLVRQRCQCCFGRPWRTVHLQ